MLEGGNVDSLPMAKKRTSQSDDKRVVVASFKGSAEFEAWFVRLSQFVRLPKTTLIEHALVAFASAEGFEEEPPER
jgi:hypothetical protein